MLQLPVASTLSASPQTSPQTSPEPVRSEALFTAAILSPALAELPMQTVILVRHGYPTNWDEKPKPRGTPLHLKLDPGLAEIGQAQARRTAEYLCENGGATVLVSSPFRRCLETAQAIAETCKVPIAADWRVGEVLLSQVLGTPFSPLSAMDPDWEEQRTGSGKPAHPESDQTIHDRVMRFVNELKTRKPFAQRIVVVSHEIILKELYKAMSGRTAVVDWHPGAVGTLTLAKAVDRQYRVVGELGSAKHLGADDRTEPVDHLEHRYHPLDSRS